MAAIIAKILTPIAGKLFEMLFAIITKLINDWLEERNQDEVDRRMRDATKNPDRRRANRDINDSFEL